MEGLEKENQAISGEVAAMQAKINEMATMQTQVNELTELVRTLRAAHNVSSPPPINTQAEAGPSTIPGWTMSFNTQQQTIFEGRPWGVPISLGEVFRPYVSKAQFPTSQNAIPIPPPLATAPRATMTYSAPAIRTVPQNEEPIFHSGGAGAYDGVHDLREK